MERNPVITWKLKESFFEPADIASNGSRFLIGNGYMGVRGTLEEYKKEHLPAINLAGIYDQVGEGWREPLNAPNGIYTYVKMDEITYSLPEQTAKNHTMDLDFRHGIFSRATQWQTNKGNIKIESKRFASLANEHLLLMEFNVTADYAGVIEIITGVDADVWDINGPHYDKIDFLVINDSILTTATTHENKDQVYLVETISFMESQNMPEDLKINYQNTKKTKVRNIKFSAKPGITYTLHKWIAIYTIKDSINFKKDAEDLIIYEKQKGFANSLQEHINIWEEKWKTSQVIIEGDDQAMEMLNYSLYHLLSIAPRHKDGLSIAARGLSGQTYKGAVFWDTEMFMLDFFINTEPDVAKRLLQYRIDTLPGALKKAKEYGYLGAFYAWESQEGGFDACSDYNVTDVFTKRPMRTYFKDKQVHISAAVVYGISNYFNNTMDIKLIENGGLEVILECAIFYNSLLVKKVNENKFEIHDVIGPDEYHERVNNNGYTNRMALFTFEKALEMLQMISELSPEIKDRIAEKYNLSNLREQFQNAVEHLYIPQPDENGIIEQFDGYKKLEDVEPKDVKKRLLHEKEYWGGAYGVASHTKVIKQADVVTWLNLFPKDFTQDILYKNWMFYEPKTEHGSSLSACMYAMLACRCDMQNLAYPLFMKSASADYSGGGKEWAGLIYIGGTHPAAAGGAYMTVVKGFAGLYEENGILKATPKMPNHWKLLEFHVCYRQKKYSVIIKNQNVWIQEITE